MILAFGLLGVLGEKNHPMKTHVEVDAVVSDSTSAGKPASFQICIKMFGGHPITDLRSKKVGYVLWLELDEAESMIKKVGVELERARNFRSRTAT